MNIKQYIESGILDNYVLGLVTQSERNEVERYVQEYPEIKKELEEIENALAEYAQLHQVTPPPHLKDKVLQEIDSLSVTNSGQTKSTGANNVPLMGIIGAFFLMAALAAIYFYSQLSTAHSSLANLKVEHENLIVSCDSLNTNLEKENAILVRQNQGLEEVINFLNSKSVKVTTMKGTEKAPEAVAEVRWNSKTQQAFVDVGTLPKPPTGYQYQLWAFVEGNPAPFSMDMVDLNAQTGHLTKVRYIPNPKVFAISLEVVGEEKSAPEGDVFVLGNV